MNDPALALLAKAFDHLGKEMLRMPLNESVRTGTQALHLEIAEFLDARNAARPINSKQFQPQEL